MIVLKMDVTSDKDVEAAYETVLNSMTNNEVLFGLVNNAGIGAPTEFEWGPDLEQGKRIIDVNLMGVIRVTRRFIGLIRSAKGRVINVESLAALLPIPHSIFYGSSKFGATGFSENLRGDMCKFGVSVVSVMPFFYNTPINNVAVLSTSFDNTFRTSSEEVRNAYGETFLEKGKKRISGVKRGFNPVAVPKVIQSALTVYEPDPRYIVAPFFVQPTLRTMLLMSKETLEVYFQFASWFSGTHKPYPKQQNDA